MDHPVPKEKKKERNIECKMFETQPTLLMAIESKCLLTAFQSPFAVAPPQLELIRGYLNLFMTLTLEYAFSVSLRRITCG